MLRDAAFRTLTSSARLFERAAKACACLAAGALTRSDLRRAIANRWETFGASETHASSGLFPWEREWFARTLKPGDRILIVGSGSGRDLIALLEQGYEVEGLEMSPGATALASVMLERRGLAARIQIGTIETAALSRHFDVLIFSWFCYCYIPGRGTRVEALRRAKGALAPGGRILISYVEASPRESRLPLAIVRLAARVSGTDWRPEPGDFIASATRPRAIHYEHRFAPGEVAGEAAEAGLQILSDVREDEGTIVLVAG